MARLRWLISSLALWAAISIVSADLNGEPSYADSTLTKIGDISPVLSIRTVDDQVVDFRNKVVVLSFFATWCGPCMAEMPRLEKGLWKPLKSDGLLLIAVGRQHPDSERAKDYTFKFAADPERTIYGKFATEFIPRCVLIGKDGRIEYQSVGLSEGGPRRPGQGREAGTRQMMPLTLSGANREPAMCSDSIDSISPDLVLRASLSPPPVHFIGGGSSPSR
jgi:thiol-disulfide isomerase/thioredoxin